MNIELALWKVVISLPESLKRELLHYGVAEEIALYVGLSLKPPTWHPILRPLKRMILQIRHIRFL